jgi:hypothetical protein
MLTDAQINAILNDPAVQAANQKLDAANQKVATDQAAAAQAQQTLADFMAANPAATSNPGLLTSDQQRTYKEMSAAALAASDVWASDLSTQMSLTEDASAAFTRALSTQLGLTPTTGMTAPLDEERVQIQAMIQKMGKLD